MAEHETTITVRLPRALLRRVATLARSGSARQLPELSMIGKISRSLIIRLALHRGLDVLEAEITPAPTRPKARPAPASAPMATPASDPAPKAKPRTRKAIDGLEIQVSDPYDDR